MAQFQLLTKTRQSTEYSCGASALQAVLSYWGRDVDEGELMTLLNTSPESGTYPEDIVRGARALGFDASMRVDLTLDEVERFTATGNPMIALAQVWRSSRDSTPLVADDWDNGHYIVVLAVDRDYVYFQDPYVRMSKAFIPRATFEEHWHQVMGGDVKKNPKLIHLGIFIKGERPAKRADVAVSELSTLNLQKVGSLNMIVTRFRGVLLPYDFLTELKDIWERGDVRPDAFIFLRKDQEGRLSALEGSRLQQDADAMAINAMMAAIASRSVGGPELAKTQAESAIKSAAGGDFGLSADQIKEIARKLPAGHSAIIVLVENVWERRFKEVAAKYDGNVINQRLIAPDALATAVSEMAAGVTASP